MPLLWLRLRAAALWATYPSLLLELGVGTARFVTVLFFSTLEDLMRWKSF